VQAQGVESSGQRFVSGIFFLSQRGGGNQTESGEANWSLPLASVGIDGEILNMNENFARFYRVVAPGHSAGRTSFLTRTRLMSD
jgi:hypothetical protein